MEWTATNWIVFKWEIIQIDRCWDQVWQYGRNWTLQTSLLWQLRHLFNIRQSRKRRRLRFIWFVSAKTRRLIHTKAHTRTQPKHRNLIGIHHRVLLLCHPQANHYAVDSKEQQRWRATRAHSTFSLFDCGLSSFGNGIVSPVDSASSLCRTSSPCVCFNSAIHMVRLCRQTFCGRDAWHRHSSTHASIPIGLEQRVIDLSGCFAIFFCLLRSYVCSCVQLLCGLRMVFGYAYETHAWSHFIAAARQANPTNSETRRAMNWKGEENINSCDSVWWTFDFILFQFSDCCHARHAPINFDISTSSATQWHTRQSAHTSNSLFCMGEGNRTNGLWRKYFLILLFRAKIRTATPFNHRGPSYRTTTATTKTETENW